MGPAGTGRDWKWQSGGRVETSYSWESGDPDEAFRVSSGQTVAGGWRKI